MAFFNLLRRNAQRVALSALLIAVMSASGIFAQASTSTVTPSGGGNGQIAFEEDRNGAFDIFIMNADGSMLHDLTNNTAMDEGAAWSPDGTQIAFTSNRDNFDQFQIYVMNADGSNVRRLTDDTPQNTGPSWSPDGKQIAYMSLEGAHWNIKVMDANGSNIRSLTDIVSGGAGDPTWLPNGRQIGFTVWDPNVGHSYAYVTNLDGSNTQFLFAGYRNPAAPAWFPDNGVQWSPDGTQIVLSMNFGIYAMKPDGSDARLLTKGDDMDTEPSWSPDGTQIVFASTRDNNSDIYTMNVDGSNVKRLTSDPADDVSPVWRP